MSIAIKPVLLKVEPSTIRAYAELTDDFNPIHLDPVFAASTPMGGVIAHGTMSICLLWQAIFQEFGERAFESTVDLDVRFIKPVREGETLSAGGQRSSEAPDLYDVWVRGDDGEDRLAGTLRMTAAVVAEN